MWPLLWWYNNVPQPLDNIVIIAFYLLYLQDWIYKRKVYKVSIYLSCDQHILKETELALYWIRAKFLANLTGRCNYVDNWWEIIFGQF